jgi:acetamidase/formamidase
MDHSFDTRSAFLAVLLFGAASSAMAADFQLAASPSTVVWGYYSAQAKPALTVHSGDTVRIQTVSSCPPPDGLESLGVRREDIPQYDRDVHEQITDKGPGGHFLTGPVAIEEAEPGDVLEVQIQKIDLDVPFACNSFGPGRGFLPNDFPIAGRKSFRSIVGACWRTSVPELTFRCTRFSAAWVLHRRRPDV